MKLYKFLIAILGICLLAPNSRAEMEYEVLDYDERSFDERSFGERSFDERSFDEHSFDENSFDEPSPDEDSLDELSNATGRELMQAVYDRHKQYPYVYEEQSMILVDRQGNKETRKLRFFSRIEKSVAKFLLLFDSPAEVKGVAVLSEVRQNGETSQSVYLPAFGNTMIANGGGDKNGNFLGTDFSVENLTGENLRDYDHRRRRDTVIKDNPYYIVDVYPGQEEEIVRGRPLKRHYIQKGNLFISRTDYFDDLGRLSKRQSQHDLTPVLGGMWRANMMLMENHQPEHQTLIKIIRRVFSADYVPAEVFTPDWLYQNSSDSFEEPEIIEAEPDESAEVSAS